MARIRKTLDPRLQISIGSAAQGYYNKFGFNPELMSNVAEDIHTLGGSYNWPTVAQIHSIVSNSDEDTAIGGNGARSVLVDGLAGDGSELIETINLNGQTPVLTTQEFWRINRMYGVEFGDTDVNEGTITATGTVDSTITSQIVAGDGQTLQACYTVPRYRVAHITQYYASILRTTAAAADVRLWHRPSATLSTSGWRLMNVLGVSQSGESPFRHEFIPYTPVPQNTDLKIDAIVTINSSSVSAGFDLILDVL